MSERETRGIQLVGVDPSREDISFLGSVDIAGENLAGPADARVLVGRELARQLETEIGRRLVIITQGIDGRNREAGFRIAGTFDADGTGLEKMFVFTGIGALQKMVDARVVTEISVKVNQQLQQASTQETLSAQFADLDVRSWQELEPQAAAMFAYADSAIFIWFLIMMGALIFGLMNTLITAVMERIKEFGMLRAVGMRPGAVVLQVVIESTLIMLVGILVGVAAGLLIVLWLADGGIDLSRYAQGVELAGMRSVLMPKLLPKDLVMVAGLSLVFGMLAALYPARRAVKIKPLEALRR
jgi:ABC-type lipoprotein release transport system permease subunit